MAGSTTSFDAGGYDYWLIKTDLSGYMLWNRTYGISSGSSPTQLLGDNPGDEQANSVVQTADQGYVLARHTSLAGGESTDAWLVKTDSFGVEQWSQVFGRSDPFDPDTDIVNSLIETTDGGFALAGSNNPGSSVHGGYFYVVKTTAVLPAPTPAPVPSPTSTPIPNSPPSASAAPSPSVPEFPAWAILPLVAGGIVAFGVKRRLAPKQTYGDKNRTKYFMFFTCSDDEIKSVIPYSIYTTDFERPYIA